MAASAVGESGTCDLTGATYCLVVTEVQLSAAIGDKHAKSAFVVDTEDSLLGTVEDGIVEDCDGSVTPDCDNVDIQDMDHLVVAPIPKSDPGTSFTVEFGLTDVAQCDMLLALLNAELAAADSTLMTLVSPAPTSPQDLSSTCIDTTVEGRR